MYCQFQRQKICYFLAFKSETPKRCYVLKNVWARFLLPDTCSAGQLKQMKVVWLFIDPAYGIIGNAVLVSQVEPGLKCESEY